MMGASKAAVAKPQLTSKKRRAKYARTKIIKKDAGLTARVDITGSRSAASHLAMPEAFEIAGKLMAAPRKSIMSQLTPTPISATVITPKTESRKKAAKAEPAVGMW